MNKKFFINTAIVFVAYMALCFVVHGLLLHADYQATGLFRSDEDQKNFMTFMIAAHVLIAGALVWIYRQGKAATPYCKQGLRFGFAIAMVSAVPYALIYYSVQNMPGMLAVKSAALDTVALMLTGVVVAWREK